MNRLTKSLLCVGATMGLIMGATAPARAATSGSGDRVTVGPVEMDDSGIQPQALLCTALQKVDWPHISSSSSELATQAHGAWNQGNCKSDTANVSVQIDRINWLGLYVGVGVRGKGVIKSSAGRSMPTGKNFRVTAHYTCKGTKQAKFRAWVDVDVIGIADAANKTYSGNPEIACG